MSGLFAKRDYFKETETLIKEGKFETALELAIKAGDSLYDRGEIEKASNLYEHVLNLFRVSKLSDKKLFEKLYEKLIPLLFEEEKTEEAIEYSLQLVDVKIVLDKEEEATEILSALKEEFKNNEKIFLKDIDMNLRKGNLTEALNTIKYMISHLSPNPKYLELAIEILLNLGNNEEALSYINALLSVDPENEFARAKLSQIKEGEGPAKEEQKVKKEPVKEKVNPPPHNSATSFKKKTMLVDKKSEKSENFLDKETFEAKEQKKEEKTDFQLEELLNSRIYKDILTETLSDPEQSFIKLINLAEDYANKGNMKIAEYLYLKALLIKPHSDAVINKIINIYEKEGRKEEEVFLLKTVSKFVNSDKKINYMIKISEAVPDNENIKVEIVKSACALNNKELALKYFSLLKNINADLMNDLLELLFPLVKEDLNTMKGLALKLKQTGIKTKTAFNYYFTVGRLLFNMQDKPEGLKWLMRANEIEKLPLEDYIEIAEYIKELPLDAEKDVVSSALSGYAEVVSSDEEKERILKLALSLKPNNTLYIKKYAEFLKYKARYKDMAIYVGKLISKSDMNSMEFIKNSIPDVSAYLTDELLIKAADLFLVAGDMSESAKIYDILQKRNPNNKKYAAKKFVLQVDGEDIRGITKFFEKVAPSHNYSEFVEPEILRFEKKRSSSPFDYHVHFVLGFLYYLTERYEEAIASFQFVLRSHKFEPLMYLFLGMSFEKIGLPEFAIKRYQSALNGEVKIPYLKKDIYDRIVSLLIKQGKMEDARKFAGMAIGEGIKSDQFKELVESGANEGKIIHMKEMRK